MSEDLYQQAILDLAKSAAGAGRLIDADASVTLDNPLGGDRITIDVKVTDGRLQAVGHKVRGCALCEAAASSSDQNQAATHLSSTMLKRRSHSVNKNQQTTGITHTTYRSTISPGEAGDAGMIEMER